MKQIEKRFGTLAVEKGFITIEQLMNALEVQVREDLAGIKHRLIGRILYDLEFLTLSQIERVIGSMDSSTVSKHSQSDDIVNESIFR